MELGRALETYKQETLIFAIETKVSGTKKQTRRGCKEGAGRVQGGCREGARRVQGGSLCTLRVQFGNLFGI